MIFGGLCFLLSFTVSATDSTKNCFVGDNFYSISDDDKTAQFVKSELTTVDIPSEIEHKDTKYKVVSIADNAFKFREDLISVSIPASVKTIGDYAFYGCWRLSEIKIPSSVNKIGNYAFWNCSVPDRIIFEGNNLTEIGESAFADCYSISEIDFPDSVKIIGKDAFKKCKSLSSIKISQKFDRHKLCNSGIDLCKDKSGNYNFKFKVSGSNKEGIVRSKEGTEVQCVCNTGKEAMVIDLLVNKWVSVR